MEAGVRRLAHQGSRSSVRATAIASARAGAKRGAGCERRQASRERETNVRNPNPALFQSRSRCGPAAGDQVFPIGPRSSLSLLSSPSPFIISSTPNFYDISKPGALYEYDDCFKHNNNKISITLYFTILFENSNR